jgi:phage protein U
MAILGAFGDVVFEVSRNVKQSSDGVEEVLCVNSFDGFGHESGMRVESHEVLGAEPLTEIVGPESETIAFTMHFALQLGVNPSDEVDQLRKCMHDGQANSLYLGGQPFGGSGTRWIIEKLSESYIYWGAQGKPIWIDVSVNLRKYVQWEQQSIATSPTRSATTATKKGKTK